MIIGLEIIKIIGLGIIVIGNCNDGLEIIIIIGLGIIMINGLEIVSSV